VAQRDGHRLGRVGDLLDQAIDAPIQRLRARPGDRHEQVVLGVEVVVEGAPGHVGGLGDLLDGDGVDAARAHERLGRLEQLPANPGPPALDPAERLSPALLDL
jgi:hypothetical protein